jgi:hypothetical protein
MAVASSPRATGPRVRAVTIPVMTPHPWMAKQVKNVPIFAREKIIRNAEKMGWMIVAY